MNACDLRFLTGLFSLFLVVPLSSSLAQEPGATPELAAAIAGVEAAGGKVYHEDLKPEKPVVAISFATTGAGDDALASLAGFTGLKKLTLNNTKISDAGLDHVKGLASLEKLYLVDTAIGDAALERIKELPALQVLSLVGTGVTDPGLEQLKDMKSLQVVFLAATKVTDEGVKKLQEALPELKVER